MKSIYNALKEPVAHYIKKDVLKEGVKTVCTLTQKMQAIEIEDKISISSNKELYKQQMASYKPSVIQERANSLFYTPKYNFSNLVRNQSYFYSSISGMDKPIDVTNDYVFKGIFSDESRTKDFLVSVLVGHNKILPEGTEIQELEYLKNEHIQNKIPEDAKKTIFDLQVKTSNGIFIIEMQKNASQDYLKRAEFYNAIAYSNQDIKGTGDSYNVEKGKIIKYPMKDYEQALPIVTISVITDRLFGDKVPCVSYHVNVERKTQEQYMKAFSYVFIELGKFNDKKYDQTNITTTNEKDWLSFMKTQDLNHKYDNEQVNSAVRYVQDIRDNKYEEYMRYQMSELAAQKEIKSAKDEGKNEKAVEMAKEMLIDKQPLEKIMKYTKLSKEQIDDIKK